MINNKLLTILRRIIQSVFGLDELLILKKMFGTIFLLLKNNGTLYTVNYLKQSRLLITRYLCGRPIYVNNHLISTRKGFPTKFLYLKEYIDSGNVTKIKVALTLMTLSRAIEPKRGEKIPIKTSTITDKGPEKFYTIPAYFIQKVIDDFNLNLNVPVYSRQDFFLSLKQGPHGPSTITIAKTIRYLTDKQLGYIRTLVGDNFFDGYIRPLREYVEERNPTIPLDIVNTSRCKAHSCLERGPFTGKLAVVHDPECKMRIIAISDYISQFTLKPLHKQIMKLLSRFDGDRTYTQRPFHTWNGTDPFYSLDLSAATDRFPIHLQQKFLTYLISKSIGSKENAIAYAQAWSQLLVDRDFDFHGIAYRYAVGQPMGSYTSWAAFSLTHHLVVQWAAYLSGMYPYNNYILLGDDIVIHNSKVAKYYMKIMHKLGVTISPTKTHVSKDTYEFAKRWIRVSNNGFMELSPIPVKGIAQNITNWQIIFSILFDYCIVRGNGHHEKSVMNLVMNIYKGITFEERNEKFHVMVKAIHEAFGGKIADAKATAMLLGYKKFKQISYTPSFLRHKLEILNASIRYSLGLATPDLVRSLLAKYWGPGLESLQIELTSIDPFIEINRILSLGIFSEAAKARTSLQRILDNVHTYFGMYGIENAKEASLFPLYISLQNWIIQMKSSMQAFNPSNLGSEHIRMDYDFLSAWKDLNFINFDELVQLHRDYHSDLAVQGVLWEKNLKLWRKLDIDSLDPDLVKGPVRLRHELETYQLLMKSSGLSESYLENIIGIKETYNQLNNLRGDLREKIL